MWSYAYLSRVYKWNGDYERAKEVLEDYIRLFGEQDRIRREMASLYISLDEMDNALGEAEKAYSHNPSDRHNIVMKGDVYFYRGEYLEMQNEIQALLARAEPDAHNYAMRGAWSLTLLGGKFQAAIEQLKEGIEEKEYFKDAWMRRFLRWLGYTYLRRGDHQNALVTLDRGLKLSEELNNQIDQCNFLYLKGVALLRRGDTQKAEQTAAKLKEVADTGLNKKLIRLYYHLQGHIALESGDFAKAIELFENAITWLPYDPSSRRADFFEPLAWTYLKMGNLHKAIEVYDRITRLKLGRFGYSDIYAESFYMIGKIYEQQSDTAKAIEHYEKFLDLWKDADPGIAEVVDAKKRVAELKSQ
jgi:tetratricopeptide (TPR) repeat protein